MSGGRRAFGLAVCLLLLAAACDRGAPADEAAPADTALPDTLTAEEQSGFAVELDRFREMQGGRLDTVDMIARGDDAAFHVQILNYGPEYTALTYAAWYTGPDSVVMFAADDQPRLVDDLGNVYRGIVIPDNPRFEVETGTTAVGVYVFRPVLAAQADSLTLFVNDSTPPVLRVGPFGVRHDATSRVDESESRLRMQPRDSDR
ncbi:MAG TPA: hypothetical protein VFG78_07255 [Gemmatimonadota bacterium]|nr:hypothetical protein [Gemmatimonadota bacterium]